MNLSTLRSRFRCPNLSALQCYRIFRIPNSYPRLLFTSFSLLVGCYMWFLSSSYLLSLAATASLVIAGTATGKWNAMRRVRHKWAEASNVIALVLQSLKSESPQRLPTAVNLALLYRVQQPRAAKADSSGASSLVAPAAEHDAVAVAPARLREAQRYMRFATSAYGHALMASFGPRVCKRAPSASALIRGADAVDLEALCRHCGVDEHDVALCRAGDEEVPAFFIAHDKQRRTIVLSVRGTASIYDAVVHDLVCVDVPFAGGSAHAGMARAAKALRAAAMPTLARLAREHPTHRVLLTGHSMGGGVAALLAVLIHHERGTMPRGSTASRAASSTAAGEGAARAANAAMLGGAAPSAAAAAAAAAAGQGDTGGAACALSDGAPVLQLHLDDGHPVRSHHWVTDVAMPEPLNRGKKRLVPLGSERFLDRLQRELQPAVPAMVVISVAHLSERAENCGRRRPPTAAALLPLSAGTRRLLATLAGIGVKRSLDDVAHGFFAKPSPCPRDFLQRGRKAVKAMCTRAATATLSNINSEQQHRPNKFCFAVDQCLLRDIS